MDMPRRRFKRNGVFFYRFHDLILYIAKAIVYNINNKILKEGIPLHSKIKTKEVDFLFNAILQLENLDECYQFFEDLCTVNELKSLSQRIVVAKMLSEGRVYSEIVKATGASTATISRVNRSLEYGCDSYSMVFGRMDGEKTEV